MLRIKFIVLTLVLCFASVQFTVPVQAQSTYVTATVNYVGSNYLASWVNVNIEGGASNVNYLFPSAQANQMLATALTALSAGKSIKIQYTGGDWTTLLSLLIVQ